MGSVVSSVVNVVEDTFEAVGDAVEDVVDVVETTVEVITENPEILVIAVAAPQMLPTIGITGAAVAPVTAGMITASQGGDLEDIGKSALTAWAVPNVAQAAGQAAVNAGLQNTLANAVGGAAGGAVAAAVQGGDVVESALLSGIASGTSAAVKEGLTGLGADADQTQLNANKGLSPETVGTIGRVAGSVAAGAAGGNVEAATTNALLGELNRELRRLSEKEIDIGFGPGKFTPEYTEEDIVGMPEEQFDRMMRAIEQDLSDQERAELEAFGSPDYSLTAGSTRQEAEGMGGAQGLRGRLGELRQREDGSIDYENIFEGEFGGEGLKVPRVPGLDSMGGGTGLTVPKEGGTVTEEGFIPEDQILRQIQEEMYPTPDFEGDADVAVEPTDLSSIQVRMAGEQPGTFRSEAGGEIPSISSRVTGEAGAGILGEKEPLFGGDEDQQRAVWNRRSLRLRRALGL